MSKITKIIQKEQDFFKFIEEKEIKSIHHLLRNYTISIHSPEYAQNAVYTNSEGNFMALHYWFSNRVSQNVLSYKEFIGHLRNLIQGNNFILRLEVA